MGDEYSEFDMNAGDAYFHPDSAAATPSPYPVEGLDQCATPLAPHVIDSKAPEVHRQPQAHLGVRQAVSQTPPVSSYSANVQSAPHSGYPHHQAQASSLVSKPEAVRESQKPPQSQQMQMQSQTHPSQQQYVQHHQPQHTQQAQMPQTMHHNAQHAQHSQSQPQQHQQP